MMFMWGKKLNTRAKLVVLIVSAACFAAIWRFASCLSFEALEEPEMDKWTETWSKIKSCSCATCISDFNVFFMKRYNRTVNPFLTPLEDITKEEFKWWKTLQRENGDLKQFMEAKKRVFTTFPSKPYITGPRLDRCRTCAVVGNSGNLKGSKYGSQIDAHDIVIRMNKAMTTGYEEDVGTKTTHRVMYPESAIDLDNNTHLVLFPFKILDLQWITEAFTTGFRGQSYAPIIPKIKANKNLVMIVNPVFMKYVHTSWLFSVGRYPSTGFMTLVLAMHICDELKIFGFGADKNGNWNHYWEELKIKNLKTGVHSGRHEYDLIQKLAKLNKVTFLRGW